MPSTYAKVDPTAQCEPFHGDVCGDVVFYDIFVNSTSSQEEMTSKAKVAYTLGNLPGIPPDCR